MRYESVIWDWNGTLLDDVALALDIVNDILHDHNLERLSAQRYRQILDFPVQTYYERAGMNFETTPFERVSERYCLHFEARIDSARLFRGAAGALADVERLGARQFLLSSTEHESLMRMVSGFGIVDRFQDIRGNPDGLARGKVEVGADLVRTHGVRPDRALVVGDTRHDWEVAQALGADCLLVSVGHQASETLAALGCPVLASVSEVPRYLARSSRSA